MNLQAGRGLKFAIEGVPDKSTQFNKLRAITVGIKSQPGRALEQED
jgi:hypothetical protein